MWRKLIRSERGSFTLEASILAPIMLLALISYLVAGLYYYQFVVVSKLAHEMVERTAYAWNHPESDWHTGATPASPRSSLYWRLGADGLGGIFRLLTGEASASVQLPQKGSVQGEGPSGKLGRAADRLADSVRGQLTYNNALIRRSVQAELYTALPAMFRPGKEVAYSIRASSVIVEPAEFIRNVDLAVRYGTALHERMISERRASEAVARFIGREEITSFAYHDQAAAYLRTIVNGKEAEFETPHGKRRIDAWDESGVVHQAFLTFTTKQLEEVQLPKDNHLIQRTPGVTGVVWHFFRRTGQTGKVGPPDHLLRKLEASGITVVLHDGDP